MLKQRPAQHSAGRHADVAERQDPRADEGNGAHGRRRRRRRDQETAGAEDSPGRARRPQPPASIRPMPNRQRHRLEMDDRPQPQELQRRPEDDHPRARLLLLAVAASNNWTVIVDMDQSGSMADSVVYGAVCGSIFASLPALDTHVVAFDTEVVDLTEKCGNDPVNMLFGVQLGGGTDINKSVGLLRAVHQGAEADAVHPHHRPFRRRQPGATGSPHGGDGRRRACGPSVCWPCRTAAFPCYDEAWPASWRRWASPVSAARRSGCRNCWKGLCAAPT